MRNTELIFIPTPTVGHLVPFLEFASRLIEQDDRIRITILLMKLQGQSHLDSYVKSIASSLPFVRFIDVPELEEKPILGSTQSVEAYVYDVIEKNITLVRNIVMDILSSLALDGVTVKGFVADFFCLPSPLFVEDGYDAYVKLAILFTKANGILVNSSFDIEPYSVNHFLEEQNYPSVYAVGPIFDLKAQPHPDQDLARRDELMKWLDDQPEASVVFLCFGSMSRLRGPLVKEIAHGLELCQYRFLWSLRTEEVTNDDLFPEGFLDHVSGWGMICGWSLQVEILAHKAVGGFVSHCGWNSIVESLWFGVPIVTWPMYAEQQLNAFLMVKELMLAVELKLDYRVHSDEIVNANEIETSIRCVMNTDNNVVRKRVMDISKMARKATKNGGSLFAAIEKFRHDVIGTKT